MIRLGPGPKRRLGHKETRARPTQEKMLEGTARRRPHMPREGASAAPRLSPDIQPPEL